MVNLKEYIHFISSLIEMDEVKNGKFILPKSITFDLGVDNHIQLHRQVLLEKNQNINDDILKQPFEIDIYDVTLNFTNDETN
jgi:hypothetical protein